jgi:hypothetical protein
MTSKEMALRARVTIVRVIEKLRMRISGIHGAKIIMLLQTEGRSGIAVETQLIMFLQVTKQNIVNTGCQSMQL